MLRNFNYSSCGGDETSSALWLLCLSDALCFIYATGGPWTRMLPLPLSQHPSCCLPASLLPLLVINNTTAAPLPPVSPPLPPCLLHTGTLPFGETDWLWWGRRRGSVRGYSCAQGSLLHRPPCCGSLCYHWTHMPLPERQEIGTVNKLFRVEVLTLRRTPCAAVWLIICKAFRHVLCNKRLI